MDEPFSAVDELTRDRLNIELLDVWARTRAAILFVTHSIEEAVFLADRVVVVSRRPARVVSEFLIPLVRPRPLSLKRDPETFNIVSRIRLALEEASR
jgi:NitT/TauT family transport system ATP-binding protein